MLEQLLQPDGGPLLRREPSWTLTTWAACAPLARTQSRSIVGGSGSSDCNGDVTTDASSSFDDEEADQPRATRRITLCKQILAEATEMFAGCPAVVDAPVLKSAACRNSGALLPLLTMLSGEQDTGRMVRQLDTLSFLLLDRQNRRACLELRALDGVLDVLRRATEPAVLFSALEVLQALCRHSAADKLTLWQHPNKGALMSMLSSRHSAPVIVEALRTCRLLAFAVGQAPPHGSTSSLASWAGQEGKGSCGMPCCEPGDHDHTHAHGDAAHPHPHGRHHGQHRHPPHHHHHHHGRGHHGHSQLVLLEPALLTVVAELLHPSFDRPVLLKALKLLTSASGMGAMGVGSGSSVSGGGGGGLGGGSSAHHWHNAVFRLVPLLTHCADVDVVEAALAVLVNLSELDTFHNMFFASGCIPPLLHLLNHKRCAISQSASCVLSALSEGGLSRDKLCQDTALLAMLRVLQAGHCVVVTLGVLYMLGRLAAYRAQVVRSLRGWGAVPLLQRLHATTRDEDAAEGCRQLLNALGVTAPPVAALPPPLGAAVPPGALAFQPGGVVRLQGALGLAPAATLPSGGDMFDTPGLVPTHITGVTPAPGGGLCRTISAAAAVAAACLGPEGPSSRGHGLGLAAGAPAGSNGGAAPATACDPHRSKPHFHASFRFYAPAGGASCGMAGPIAAAVPPAAAY
ncbi:hypothetical protein HYH03_006655 [Edaphochlamys debaryana]|uniref:Uncharacterized protein n=1 Tax=Edaphochlamys debaryana TaxID=47281 RepID=A0A836C102_9CHLO|nr:hypothetical protein HYH03_006655 [Edaphochlamys debaryana]|eukprot:KAG2495387.1 hypothetical protein HYH03_006655 [Edaphochlamys debaryana]